MRKYDTLSHFSFLIADSSLTIKKEVLRNGITIFIVMYGRP